MGEMVIIRLMKAKTDLKIERNGHHKAVKIKMHSKIERNVLHKADEGQSPGKKQPVNMKLVLSFSKNDYNSFLMHPN